MSVLLNEFFGDDLEIMDVVANFEYLDEYYDYLEK